MPIGPYPSVTVPFTYQTIYLGKVETVYSNSWRLLQIFELKTVLISSTNWYWPGIPRAWRAGKLSQEAIAKLSSLRPTLSFCFYHLLSPRLVATTYAPIFYAGVWKNTSQKQTKTCPILLMFLLVPGLHLFPLYF